MQNGGLDKISCIRLIIILSRVDIQKAVYNSTETTTELQTSGCQLSTCISIYYLQNTITFVLHDIMILLKEYLERKHSYKTNWHSNFKYLCKGSWLILLMTIYGYYIQIKVQGKYVDFKSLVLIFGISLALRREHT